MKPNPPRRGHPITALTIHGTLIWLRVYRVVRNRIDTRYDVSVRTRDKFGPDLELAQFPLLVSSENITWCRGHVLQQDETAAAMLASAAMAVRPQ